MYFCLQIGNKIRVISQVSDDWLFGELDDRRGNFPSSFVDRVPPNLPRHATDGGATPRAAIKVPTTPGMPSPGSRGPASMLASVLQGGSPVKVNGSCVHILTKINCLTFFVLFGCLFYILANFCV